MKASFKPLVDQVPPPRESEYKAANPQREHTQTLTARPIRPRLVAMGCSRGCASARFQHDLHTTPVSCNEQCGSRQTTNTLPWPRRYVQFWQANITDRRRSPNLDIAADGFVPVHDDPVPPAVGKRGGERKRAIAASRRLGVHPPRKITAE